MEKLLQMSDYLFGERIDEKTVARVLSLITEQPNRREVALSTDLSGKHDFWSDGGAGRIATSVLEFELKDGTRVFVACPLPWLSMTIQMSDGPPGRHRAEPVTVGALRRRCLLCRSKPHGPVAVINYG